MIVSIRDILTEEIPSDLISIDEIENVLNAIYVSDFSISVDQDGIGISLTFNIENTVSAQVPGINGLILLLGEPGRPTIINLYFKISEKGFACEVYDLIFSLQFPPDILHPHPAQNPPTFSHISVRGNLGIDEQFNFNIDGFDSLSLSSAMIGNTGLVIAATGIKFDFSRTSTIPEIAAAGLDESFMGVYLETVTVRYEKEGDSIPYVFTISKAAIGDGGFTGEIGLGTTQAAARDLGSSLETILTDLFDDDDNAIIANASEEPTTAMYPVNLMGMKMVLQYFGLRFHQSVPIGSQILGYVFIPLANKWVSLHASIGGPNGDFLLEIGGVGNEGLISLDTDVFKVTADSIAYLFEDPINYAVIAGSIRLKLPTGLNLPEFKVQKLKIGSDGSVKIEGGWLRAPQQVNIDLGGFKIGIKEIGLGTDGTDGGDPATQRQWVGFSGEVQLIESLPIKGSVDGLKISWLKQNPGAGVHVELRGIGVEFKIPGALEFAGTVNYDRTTNLFKGHIKINFISLRFEVEADLMVGKYRDSEGHEFGVFYIHLGAKFPVPIVLGATGMGLSGIEGLVGINVAPNKTATEKWHDWYKNGATDEEKYNVTPVSKWAPMNDNFAFGAGVKVGTVYDDGTTLNITALLLVLIPGPVIMLEGTVNLLKARSDDKREEGAFNILAVLDCRAGTFQLNIDVRYSLQDIITISGGLEAFFNFNDSNDWHIWIGQKTPESKRIRADILKIFSANVYFMIDPQALQLGASVGFKFEEEYGPAKVNLTARFSFDAAIFFKPFQLEGSMELVADLGVTVFGIGLRLLIEAMLGIKTPKPFEIYGKARVKLQLFWPIPEVGFEVEFKWTTPAITYPTWPLLKAEEAKDKDGVTLKDANQNAIMLPMAFMQHHKSTSFEQRMLQVEIFDPNSPDIRCVPIDVRPRLTFAKSLHFIGDQQLNDQPDQVGSGTFWYHLNDLTLYEWNGSDWNTEVLKGINVPFAQQQPGQRCFQLTVSTTPQTGNTSFINDNTAKEPIIELWQYGVWDTLGSHQGETEPTADPACGRVTAWPDKRTIDWTNDRVGDLPGVFWKEGVQFVVEPLYRSGSPLTFDLLGPHVIPYIGVPATSVPSFSDTRMLRTRSVSLNFSERVFDIEVFIFFDNAELQTLDRDYGTITIRAYADGNEVGTVIKSDPGLIISLKVVHSTGFNSVIIEEIPIAGEQPWADKSFWVHSIRYTTYDRPVNPYLFPMNVGDTTGTPPRRLQAVRTVPVLKPATIYRLKVETMVTSTPAKGTLVLKDLEHNAAETNYFYFKTDNGPGFPAKPYSTERLLYAPELPASPNAAQPDATVPSGMPSNPDARYQPKPNPVNLLSTYILATYPAHGAAAHYFKESVVIAFNEAYVLNMWTGRQLELRLKDRNGKAPADSHGHPLPPVVIDLTPESAAFRLICLPLYNPGLMIWTAALRMGGCHNGNSPAAVMAPSLAFPVSGLNLSANTLYFAELWSNAVSNPQEMVRLYDFQFTTSRYADFKAHITALGLSESVDIAKTHRVSEANVGASSLDQTERVAAQTSYRGIIANYKHMLTDQTQTYGHDEITATYDSMVKAKADWEKTAAGDFDSLYKALDDAAFQKIIVPGRTQPVDMRHRGLPEKPEIIQIPLQNTQTSLLLFESPEPLDWANITGTIRREGVPGSFTFRVLPNADKTRAFFLINGQLDFGAGRFTFKLTFDPFTEYSNKLDIGQDTEADHHITFILILTGNYTPIAAGAQMAAGQEMSSPDGSTRLMYLLNGNLNLMYRNNLIWSSRTEGQLAGRVEMQTDGNLVMYSPQHAAIWSSGTVGAAYAGSALRLYNQGQLSIFAPVENRNVWTTGMVDGSIPRESLQIGESLLPSQSLYSNNRQFRLTYQPDGNLVLYRSNDGGALWASGTQGQPAGRFEMKPDGILAIYGPNNAMLWAARYPGSQALSYRLQLADAGTVHILSPDGTVATSIEQLVNVSPRPENFIAFRHVVHAGNVTNAAPNSTILDHPQLNGNPTAVLFVSPVWGHAKMGIDNPNIFGIQYQNDRWIISNQDILVPMLIGANFHVLITFATSPYVLVHQAVAVSLSMNRTYIDHPATNHRPFALLMVTRHFIKYNEREIGVAYEPAKEQWFIYNKRDQTEDPYDESRVGIPLDAKFNILVTDSNNASGIRAFVHQVDDKNIIPEGQHISFLDYPAINKRADASLFFTESWLTQINGIPTTTGGVSNRSVALLWYDAPVGHYSNKEGYWAMHNAGNKPMEQGRMFNIFLLDTSV